MPITEKEAKELWVAWTHDALVGYTRPDDIEDIDDIVDDMVDTSTKYADSMLDVYEETFGNGAKKRAIRRRKKKKDEDDEEDDEE